MAQVVDSGAAGAEDIVYLCTIYAHPPWPRSHCELNGNISLLASTDYAALAKKTVLLITHQLQFLQNCDSIVALKDGMCGRL